MNIRIKFSTYTYLQPIPWYIFTHITVCTEFLKETSSLEKSEIVEINLFLFLRLLHAMPFLLSN